MDNLTWKDVFNSYNIFPQPFGTCLEKAKSVGYEYMAFNGRVYNVDETLNSGNFIEVCLESDLDKPVTVVNNYTTITPSPSDMELYEKIKKLKNELKKEEGF